MFKVNDYGKIDIWCSENEFSGNYAVTTEFLKLAISTDGTFDYTETDNYGNEYKYVKDYWFKYFWLKSDFLNFPSIRKIGISEEYYKNSLEADSEELLYDFLAQLTKQEEDEEAKEKAKNVSIQFFQEVAELKKPLKKSEDENTELLIDSKVSDNTLDKVRYENEKLKAELLEKDQKIKDMELIQTTENESKLGSTRAENNVSKLILVLSAQAKIDTSKPYAQYESLKAQAELL